MSNDLPTSMLPDFEPTGIPPPTLGKVDFGRKYGEVFVDSPCCLYSEEEREKFISKLSKRVARLVVDMTQGTCKCGKTPDACCQTT